MSLKKIVIMVEILLLTVLVIYLSVLKDNDAQNESSNSSSMKEAYRIAHKAIIKENPNVLLYSMGSADSNDNPEDITAGKSGLRKYWNVVFAVPSTTDYWLVMVRNKKIKDIIKVMGASLDKTDFIDNMDSLINSNEALHIAKDEYKLKPGEGWAIGYHFLLNKTSGTNTIVVVGRDPSKNFARVAINAKTKEIIDAIHKVSYDGVTYNWEQFIKP
jgi:hypothetical protein